MYLSPMFGDFVVVSFITFFFSLTGCYSIQKKRIGGVMVSVLPLHAVDLGFEPQSGQAKYYKMDICCFSA